MHEIRTNIEIKASAGLVWAILTDFSTYKRWNPFIRSVVGQPHTGNSIQVTLQPQGEAATTFRPTLTHVREPRELRWFERWTLPGLYSAEHRFSIESLPDGGVRFDQTQRCRGMLAPFLRKRLQRTSTPAFNAMNAALKARAERAESNLAAAGRAHA
jgi:hypothetical protein